MFRFKKIFLGIWATHLNNSHDKSESRKHILMTSSVGICQQKMSNFSFIYIFHSCPEKASGMIDKAKRSNIEKQ
jgi:hypothetical protein